MAIVLQQDMRKADSIFGRVFCGGRYYGDFTVDLGCFPAKSFVAGSYSLHSSIVNSEEINVLDRTGRTIATLSYKRCLTSKLCIMVGQDGLVFRPTKTSFDAIKELFDSGFNVLVIRDPLLMK